jgi:prepilin-type N-terminal cleavage/methylation domain-containing protein
LDTVVVMKGRATSDLEQRDGGFTLAELLVAITLFVVALGVAYMALQALVKANNVAMQEATFARNITYPIDQFSKYAMQCDWPLVYADAYRFDFWVDVHGNSTPELMSFSTDSSGRFYKRTQQFNATKTAVVGALQSAVLSTDNANVARGRPLFTYYDNTGLQISSSSTVLARADSVKIAMVVKYGVNTMESTGTVTFRNRNY